MGRKRYCPAGEAGRQAFGDVTSDGPARPAELGRAGPGRAYFRRAYAARSITVMRPATAAGMGLRDVCLFQALQARLLEVRERGRGERGVV